jgi:ornithine cyclodeaminase
MKVFDAEATAEALPYLRLIEEMRRLFADGLRAPDRHHHNLPMVGEADGTLLLMPIWDENVGCIKIVTVTPGNTARSLPSIAGSVLVFDRATGAHLALLDGAVLTARRTAAASALAADYLAPPDAGVLQLIGAGRVAAQLPAAFSNVRPIKTVRVWDIFPEAANRLAETLRADGYDAEAVDDLARSVPEADIVSTATLATDPILKGDWLRPGQHVDLIGAFTPAMREADDRALQRARIFVDTPFAAVESGELKIPLEQGAISQSDLLGDLSDLATERTGRSASGDITLFKTVGNAVMDLAAALAAMEQSHPE